MPRRPSRKKRTNIDRRQWLAMLGITGAAGLAGCLGDGDDEGDGDSTDTPGESMGTDTPGESTDTDTPGLGDDTKTPRQEEELPSISGTFNSPSGSTYSTLNPLFNTEANAGAAIALALDTPYTFDGGQNYFGNMFDLSTDDGGKTWVASLRDGMEFSDPYGSVTADSFVYPIQELHTPDWAPTAASSDWTKEINVETTGELEFQVEIPTADILWPEGYVPSIRPYPKDLLESYVSNEDVEGMKKDEELLELQFTGNLGPYKLEEWNRSAAVNFTRNEDYYLRQAAEEDENVPNIFSKAPYFEEYKIEVIKEKAARLGALKKGELDSASIDPTRLGEFRELDSVDVYEIPQPYNDIMSVNMRDNGWTGGPGNLFRYKEFRQALACSINTEKTIEGIYNGIGKPHYTWQPKFSRFYPSDADFPKFGSGDLYGQEIAKEKAQQAIEKSEHDYGFDGNTLLTPDGNTVELKLLYYNGSNTDQTQAEFMAQELDKNLGLKINSEGIGGRAYRNDYWVATPPEDPPEPRDIDHETWSVGPNNAGPRQVTPNKPHDMGIVYGLNTYPRNPITNDVFFDGPDAFYNPMGYYPEFNASEKFTQAREAESIEEFQSVMSDIFVALAEEQPYIMMVFNSDLSGYTSKLNGPIENFSNGWDSQAWHFEE